MKTFRMFGMALVAIVMGVSLASCSKDENPNSNGKKVVKIALSTESQSDFQAINLNYDDKGRLIEAIFSRSFNGQTSDYIREYTWSDDIIKTSEGITYTLSNGLIYSDGDEHFIYDQLGRLIEYGDKSRWETKVIWNDDKFVTSSWRTSDRHTTESTWTYGESCKNGYSPFTEQLIHINDDIFFVAHPELAGIRTTQLPVSCTSVDYDNGTATRTETTTYTYKFDDEGYVSEYTEINENSSYSYIFTWE